MPDSLARHLVAISLVAISLVPISLVAIKVVKNSCKNLSITGYGRAQ